MKFSIIIPVYNAAKYLRPCLDSVLAQTYADWECICVDDGSTDGSPEILKEFQAKAKGEGEQRRIKVFRQANAGVSAARNRGLEVATGEYVCFGDADDTVQPNWLEKYEKKFAETGADVVRLENHGEWALDGYPWKYAIRREVALKARFPEGVAMSEDGIYVARVLPYVTKISVLGEMTYNYVPRPGTAMIRPLASEERLRFLKTVRDLAAVDSPVGKEVLSRFAADAVITWLGRPKDLEHWREIRSVWKELDRKGCAAIGVLRPLLRVPYLAYVISGRLWPTRLLLGLIRWLVVVKNHLLK